MEDFFEVTTSNFTEEDDKSIKEQKEKEEKKKKEEKSKNIHKQIKSIKSYNSLHIREEFLYHPDVDLCNLSNYMSSNIAIKIEKKFFSKRNRNLKKNKIWGTDYYTSKSDPVCIFLHFNIMSLKEIKKKNFEFISLILHVSKCKKNYLSSERNGIKSKKLANISNLNYKLYNIKPISYKFFNKMKFETYYKLSEKLCTKSVKRHFIKPNFLSDDYSLVFGEMVFNMNSELAFKYDLINICDKSNKCKDFLNFFLNSHFLILETKAFEKFFVMVAKKENLGELEKEIFYKICKVRNPQEINNAFFENNEDFEKELEVLSEDLLWSDIIWDSNSVLFKENKIDDILSFKFYKTK